MALTEEKVRSIVEKDGGMADALEAVYAAAENGTVEWADVNDDISSGHWGRLIEQGILVDDGGGFRFEDPEAVEDILHGVDEGEVAAAEEEDESSGWSKWDKLAGLAALGLFAGYSMAEVRAVIGGLIDVFVSPLNQLVPFYIVVLIIAVVTGAVSTVLQSKLIDSDKMGEYQQRMKQINERRKEAKERGDDEELKKIQKEQMDAMGDQAGMMKEQFRPTVWIMLFSIPFFLWIYWKVLDGNLNGSGLIHSPMVGEVSWTEGVLGPMQMWIVWYFICSMAFSNIIRKALNIQITPST